MGRRRRGRRYFRWIAIGLIVAIGILFTAVVASPLYLGRLQFALGWEIVDAVYTVSVSLLIAIWIFFFGASIASFANVMAHRWPRGRSILGRSRCPWCAVPLTFKSNFPVLGWLASGGRCRSCRLPISPRYILVEILLGSLFVLIIGVGIGAGGVNLPLAERPQYTIPAGPLVWGDWNVLAPVTANLYLVTVLMIVALIRSDHMPMRLWITGFFVLVAVGLVVLLPQSHLIPWWARDWPQPYEPHRLTAMAGFLVGFGVGTVMSWLLAASAARGLSIATLKGWFPSLSLSGAVLGWHAIPSLALISGLLLLLRALVFVKFFPLSERHLSGQISWFLLLAVVIHFLLWHHLVEIELWPAGPSPWFVTVPAIVGSCLLNHFAPRISNFWSGSRIGAGP